MEAEDTAEGPTYRGKGRRIIRGRGWVEEVAVAWGEGAAGEVGAAPGEDAAPAGGTGGGMSTMRQAYQAGRAAQRAATFSSCQRRTEGRFWLAKQPCCVSNSRESRKISRSCQRLKSRRAIE